MIMKMKTIIKDQKGASAVEFAIILPLLVLVIFGIIEFSLLLYNKQVITNAAREGARYGIIVKKPPEELIIEKIKSYAQNRLLTFGSDTLEDDDIQITRHGLTFGEELEVVVDYEYGFLVLNFAKIDFTATSIMRME